MSDKKRKKAEKKAKKICKQMDHFFKADNEMQAKVYLSMLNWYRGKISALELKAQLAQHVDESPLNLDASWHSVFYAMVDFKQKFDDEQEAEKAEYWSKHYD